MRFPTRSIGSFIALIAVSACENPIAPDTTPAHVNFTSTTTTLFTGSTLQLTAIVVNKSHEPLEGRSIAWTSTDQSVATVAASGIVTAVSPGTVIIRAEHGTIFGVIQLTVQERVCDAATAVGALSLGQTVSGSIAMSDCLMWGFARADGFAFTLLASDTVLFRAHSASHVVLLAVTDASTDLSYGLVGTSSAGDTARMALVLPAGTVRVWGMQQPFQTSAYTVSAVATTLCTGTGQAGTIAPAQSVNGSLTSASCLLPHFFEGSGYTFTLDSTTGVAFSAKTDGFAPAIVVTDNALNVYSVGFPVSGDSASSLDLIPPGTYTAWVTTLAGGLGGFELSRANVPILSCSDATAVIAIEQTVNGSLAADDCRLEGTRRADLYELTVPTGRSLHITQTSPDFDTYLIVRDSLGQVVAYNDDSNGTLDSHIVQFFAAGVYTVVATSYGGGELGNYVLRVSESPAVHAAPGADGPQLRAKTAPPNSPSNRTASPSRANRSSWLKPLR